MNVRGQNLHLVGSVYRGNPSDFLSIKIAPCDNGWVGTAFDHRSIDVMVSTIICATPIEAARCLDDGLKILGVPYPVGR